MTTPSEPTPPAATPPATEDRTVAILSYLTLIGFIVALILHSSKKTALGSYHLRQTLGLIVSGFAFGIVGIVLMFIPIIGWLAVMAGWVFFLVMVVMGLVAAASGKQQPVPVLGAHFQKWFGGAFN